MPQCDAEEFGNKEAIPGTGFYSKPKCAETGSESTVIGVNRVTVYAGPGGVSASPEISDLPLEGITYNVVPPEGKASDFGVALELPKKLTKGVLEKAFAEHPLDLPEPEKKLTEEALENGQYYAHTMIEGNVEWAGNYHDYYEINVSTALPLISSRLVLKGEIGSTGKGGYITLPSNCAGAGPATTNTVTLETTGGETGVRQYVTPIGSEGCDGASPFLEVPFKPEFNLSPATTQQDKPDGITTELKIPHAAGSSETDIDTSQLRTASVTLPEGMTINPSAAGEVKKACTPAQARIHSSTFGVECPSESEIGSVTLEVPTLPAESLKGNLYLGGPEGGGAITGPPYTVYLNAQSTRYGVDVRVEGKVVPNESTGQLTATFGELPEQPFSNAIIHFKGGEQCADRQPADVWGGEHRGKPHSLHGTARVCTDDHAVQRRQQRLRGLVLLAAAVLVGPERRQPAPGLCGREDLVHAERPAQRRPAVPVADQDRPAGGSDRAAADRDQVRRSRSQRRDLPGARARSVWST